MKELVFFSFFSKLKQMNKLIKVLEKKLNIIMNINWKTTANQGTHLTGNRGAPLAVAAK